MDTRIMFAGEGHGAVAALKSLQKKYARVEIISHDQEVLSLRREGDLILNAFSQGQSGYVVLAGYKKLIPPHELKMRVFINTHPSLLPAYRGFHSVVWAMLNMEKELGFTIHLVNEFLDDGDILHQYKINYNGQTSKEIMDAFDAFAEAELGSIVHEYISGNIQPVKQDKSKATWVGKRNLGDCIIDFSWECERLQMLFKALVKPYPLPRIVVGGKPYEVVASKIITDKHYFTHVGRVLNIDAEGVWIKTKDGFLTVTLLADPENGTVIPAAAVLKLGMRLV
ncbi:MAG: formyltransferase family protein [Negativicutes bacterium]|nr:formyltransferase family protein [Negativicutes bacterium]